jgi:hypothetical protein
MAIRRIWIFTATQRGQREVSRRRRPSVLFSGAAVLGTVFSFAAAGGGSAAMAVVPVIAHAPRVAVPVPHGIHETWASSNWSGYAESGSFTGVTSTWTVPSVAASSSNAFSSAWIGVDGFNNNNLIQTGTEEDWYNGSVHYNAWWEILPAAETALPSGHPVAAGDRMSASIEETSTAVLVSRHRVAHYWWITISDTTARWTFSTYQLYAGPGASAEWVVEAPQVGGSVATLARYSFGTSNGLGTTTGDFDSAGVYKAVVTGGTPTPPPAPPTVGAALTASEAGVMVQSNVQVSTPSNPDRAATAYNAAYGATAPGAPTS